MSAITGAIVGDIAGSKYEFNNTFSKKIKLLDSDCWFTDDTVMTLAIASAVANNLSYDETLRTFCKMNDYINSPKCSFGGRFYDYVMTGKANYSFGNGSAIRVSYLGQYCRTLQEAEDEAEKAAKVSHTHPDGIRGARCIASLTWLANDGWDKRDILEKAKHFYPIRFDEIKPSTKFNVSCFGSIPVAVKAFITTDSYADCIKTAISYGGDSDCIACMAGGIAGAYYKIRPAFEQKLKKYLDSFLWGIYKDLPQGRR